jgi:voltage-gated potassium channel Kch
MKHGLAGKIRYRFDNLMAKGAPALIVMLALLTVVLLSVFALAVWLTGIAPKEAPEAPDANFLDAFWMSLMRTLDSGTMGGDTGAFGLVMLGVTIVGIFIVSALIGIINNGLEAKLEDLRKGRSTVVEKDHTVILGWSEQIFTIIPELVEANRSRRKACIVVMGDTDKVEMEDTLKERIEDFGNTRVVCRSGSPISMGDLPIVSPDDARSIIILSPETEDPDAEVIKTLLALTNNPSRKEGKYHIVAEIRDPKNMEIAAIVGKDEVELVLVGDLISRVIAQTCRQSGLSVVYTELLDFGGDEIYFKEEPVLAGKPFGEVLNSYPKCTIMGILPLTGEPRVNPPMDTVVHVGDQLIVIAEDDDKITLPKKRVIPAIERSVIRQGTPVMPVPEKNLILGWNWRAPVIITELDNYVAKGSEILIVADDDSVKEVLDTRCQGLMKNQKISFTKADTTDRSVLDTLNPEQYHSIILLSYSDSLGAQQADAKSLMTLLHLRDMAEKSDSNYNVVSEMLDVKNRELADVAKVDDFIVSERLISLLLTQISENKKLNLVFKDLFNADGSEIYVKPAGNYVETGKPVNFYTVTESARLRGEIAIGYKIIAKSHSAEDSYGVVVNPDKGGMVTFKPEDKIIVLAED